MDFLNEYGLLIAVALLPAVVVVINVILAATGESGTLLLPSLRPYPAVEPGPARVSPAVDSVIEFPEPGAAQAVSQPEPAVELPKAA